MTDRKRILMALALAATLPTAAAAQDRPALAQGLGEIGTAAAQMTPRPGISMPVIDYRTPEGFVLPRRGIVAGVDVSKSLTFGLGLFESVGKKTRPETDHPLDVRPKTSRKAAVGLSLRF